MNKTHRYRERVRKGNKELINKRAASHNLTKNEFIQKIAVYQIAILNHAGLCMLELQGVKIPESLRPIVPKNLGKRMNCNTEVIGFDLIDKHYEMLNQKAIEFSFTGSGNIGQLLDEVAYCEVVFRGIDYNGIKWIVKGGKK